MDMNTLTPKLRNSSIIGKRFTNPVDPLIKIHLTELNNILGKNSFSDVIAADPADVSALEDLKVKMEAAKEEENSLEEEVQSLEKIVVENEELLAEAHNEAADLQDQINALKKGDPNVKVLQEQLREKRKTINELKRKASSSRKEADDTLEKYFAAKENADTLSEEFVNTAMDAAKNRNGAVGELFDLETELRKPIFAKKTESDHWDDRGILNFILANVDEDKLTISDCIDKVNELSNLKNEFQSHLNKNWNTLSNDQKAILHINFSNIFDYMIAYAYWVKGITEVNALFNFITTNKNGAPSIKNYLVISAARAFIQKNAIKIHPVDGDTYNDDTHPLIRKIASQNIELSEETFLKEITKVIKGNIDNAKELKLIETGLALLKIDDLPASYIPMLIQYLRKSSVKIDSDNIGYFLPSFINEIRANDFDSSIEMEDPEVEQSDEDFDVDFSEDIKTVIKANLSNVKCAAQLFSSAIMEVDLDIFNLTNYLTNNYLIKNRIDIEDQRLRQNLQMFVFSNKFIDSKNGQITERTKDGERNHFYRQVLNIGAGPVPQGIIINTKFAKLWKKLTPAVKNYLDNSSSSLQSDAFVSKGGVMQIVASMQTNLSDSCTGMAKIISPIINAEWNFIKDKILGHPEIVKQISPTVGTWKGVAQTLFASMKQHYVDATLVYQKANICNKILNAVAVYDAPVFEQDNNFIDFCSMVIELDELLQSMTMEMEEENEVGISDDSNKDSASKTNHDSKTPQAATAGSDEWDF